MAVLTPQDDWIAAFESGGRHTLANGTYDASGETINVSHKLLKVTADNLGKAKIIGSWDTSFSEILLRGMDIAPENTKMLMSANMSDITLFDTKCDVRSSKFNIPILVQTYGGIFRLRSNDRTNRWLIGSGIKDDVFDFDQGAAVKVVGNVTKHPVRMDYEKDVDKYLTGLTCDTAHLLLAGYRHYSSGKNGRGVDLRRNSSLTVQAKNNRFQGLHYAVMARQNSRAWIAGTTFSKNTKNIWTDKSDASIGVG